MRKEEATAWEKRDVKARGVLGKVIPNSIYMEISEFKRFHEMWEAVECAMPAGTVPARRLEVMIPSQRSVSGWLIYGEPAGVREVPCQYVSICRSASSYSLTPG